MDDGITDFSHFKIGIAGLGLIGGSLAKAFTKAGYTVAGFDTDKKTVAAAIEYNAVAVGGCEPSVLCDCDFVFVALYPDGVINFVENNHAVLKKGAVVVDCCGIKGEVCKRLFAGDFKDITFIGGHPMAGTERSGFEASFPGLFNGASFIIAPKEGTDPCKLETLKKLVLSAGFGRTVITTPENHDKMIAFTSQIPHVLACSYVLSPCCPQHHGFSAGSYLDISRVAHINASLWAQLFIDNKDALTVEIDTLIDNIIAIRDAVKSEDRQSLEKLLQQARETKDNADLRPENF